MKDNEIKTLKKRGPTNPIWQNRITKTIAFRWPADFISSIQRHYGKSLNKNAFTAISNQMNTEKQVLAEQLSANKSKKVIK